MAPIIKTEKLCHLYSAGTPFERLAIKDIDFEAEKGEFIGVIGHTGSGKSTFIQHLNGLLKPTSGRILFNGTDIWENKSNIKDVRFKVGIVFQYPEYQLFEETVYKDIAFGPKNMKLSDTEIDLRVRQAADFVELEPDILEKSPFELSGGQKRRVAIAGVIAMRPDVLVLDEPTAGLDPKGRDTIIENIRKFHETMNSTVILVTHDMDQIAKTVHRLVVFDDSRIIMNGTPAEIFSHGERLQEIGLSIPEITRVIMRLRELGLPLSPSIYTVEHAKKSLLELRGGMTYA